MKKILLSILTFLGIGLSFCSAQSLINPNYSFNSSFFVPPTSRQFASNNPTFSSFTKNSNFNFSGWYVCIGDKFFTSNFSLDEIPFYRCPSSTFSQSDCDFLLNVTFESVSNYYLLSNSGVSNIYCYLSDSSSYFGFYNDGNIPVGKAFYYLGGYYNLDVLKSSFNSSNIRLIDVQYNNGNTSTIICDGINYISIDGLSTLTNSNVNYKYSPYINIDYRDEDNQSLIESYDKSILYLDNGQFKKTYTGNNDWILTVQGGNSNNSFSGYLPTFEITGGIDEVSTSGNIFNNFAENSLKFTLSNIPSYIQYVIIIMLLLFVLGFIRKFKRR